MVSFVLSMIALIVGYIVYGKVVEKCFGANDDIKTPAIRLQDGVDFVPMSEWKIFLIQFLNIAGLGPIFGAIAGAMWGPSAFLWIVFGCIFAGAVHDYLSGMLSVRHDGASISEVVGKYLGNGFRKFMIVFSVVLLVLTGVVFVSGPAGILHGLINSVSKQTFLYIIFAYYVLATLLPIDKLIGKIYPIFGICLLVMAIGVAGALIIKGAPIPEVVGNLKNMHVAPAEHPLFPMLFITIACGAISGFHSTQSPLMARCITKESQGRRIFLGAMIAEGIVALIWAAAAMSYFGGVPQLNNFMVAHNNNAGIVVNQVCNGLLGKVGGALAILGVVACPITSGDTAFRSARLTISDSIKFDQTKIKKRLMISIPLFAIGFGLTLIDFGKVWRYFGWSNQTLATIVLWSGAMYLLKKGKQYLIAMIPAVFMTAVCTTYILVAPEGFKLSMAIGAPVGIIVAVICLLIFLKVVRKIKIKSDSNIDV
ncbi:carbon starvation CstA family protein [Clostridium botulinum]|uniref:carbon starvation CstA family protein n=1 Tax=Clostridium botulinum TaxID=1491 RepID=UPI0004D6AB26|nr:carbon starvation protein A [Clostridium botulinum]KEI00489.1 carbon starvation protein CstA [Clostridium botulinum C/D str. BKT75002]KEI07319.1 carbon starvation protein CstA [Clostridium botulinum C/D str. BKT2873]MCD3351358.1 carbon starvation protein A [Clostridium botulinum D/C]MCD3360314.1 carbon starvation protein A [Clostridium botulinum D/C]MCD3363515.1 carbon starvation protein A [Clostridium botulinum D/C]